MSLTDTAARNAKARDKAYKLSDAKGLYLLVNPNGSKLWRLKYRFNDTEKKLSIGPYPRFLSRQLGARSLLENGVDAGEFKKQAKRAASVAGANTFEAIAREWFLKFSRGWAESHSSHVLLRLENDLFCWLGSRPVAAIEADELLETMRRIEARGARQCPSMSRLLWPDFSLRDSDCSSESQSGADLRGALPPAKGGHFANPPRVLRALCASPRNP